MWEPPANAEARPDREYERSRERQDIAELMAALPERYRAPLQLRYVEGLRLEEVATVLRQPARHDEVQRPPRESTPCARPCRGRAGRG